MRWMIGLVLTLSLFGSANLSLAQSDTSRWETYRSPDGLLSLQQPARWVTAPNAVDLDGVTLANSSSALQRIAQPEQALRPHDQAMVLLLISFEKLQAWGYEVDAQTPQADLTISLSDLIMGTEQSETILEAPISLTLAKGQGVKAGQLLTVQPFTNGPLRQSGLVSVRALNDEVALLAAAFAHPARYNAQLESLFGQIIGSVAYQGGADDLSD